MSNTTKHNYFQKIQTSLRRGRSIDFEIELLNVPETQLEAFWHLMNAGYPTNFVVSNYINLYEFVRKNSLDYTTALKHLYSVYPGLYAGVSIKELKIFELN